MLSQEVFWCLGIFGLLLPRDPIPLSEDDEGVDAITSETQSI